MHTVQKVTYYLGLTNLGIGITSFIGLLVQGNDDRFVNLRPGLWLGVFGMNWVHALLHLVVGLIGLPASNTITAAINYMRLHAVLFGFLAVVGVLRVRGSMRIHMVMGMALNMPANVVHILWAGMGLLLGYRRITKYW